MIKYNIMRPQHRGLFTERVTELDVQLRNWLNGEGNRGRQLRHVKIFLSDIQNQYNSLTTSRLYTDLVSKVSHTIIEQPPVDGSKITMLAMTSDENARASSSHHCAWTRKTPSA